MVESPRTVDPILSFPVHSFVSSLCFVSPRETSSDSSPAHPSDIVSSTPPFIDARSDDHHDNDDGHRKREDDDDDDDDDSDSDDEQIVFRSATVRSRVSKRPHRGQDFCSSSLLRDRYIVSCHRDDGEALLWDVNRQETVGTVATPRGGAGLAVRRTHDPSKVLVHTKDPNGIVSLHSIERCSGSPGPHVSATNITTGSSTIRQFETFSYTFCQAAPCLGDENLLALPSRDDSTAVVMDSRAKTPVETLHVQGHGMLTSLALASNPSHSRGGILLACGMESGTTVFYDLAPAGSDKASYTSQTINPTANSTYELGKDPILTLDLASSGRDAALRGGNDSIRVTPDSLRPGSGSTSVLVAAGMAGDAAEVADLKQEEAGRVVLFKTSVHNESGEGTTEHSNWTFENRARLSTCRVGPTSYGKPGVSICRFRPEDGRLLAVGGWDYRIRIFERAKGAPMAILKGNGGGSIAALDWAPDAAVSGLMVSAPANAKSILLWQCFASAGAV